MAMPATSASTLEINVKSLSSAMWGSLSRGTKTTVAITTQSATNKQSKPVSVIGWWGGIAEPSSVMNEALMRYEKWY
jgi:hypothetical protein